MPLTASELIDDAVLAAAPHIREDQTAPGPLLRALTGADSDIVRQVARYAPERLSAAGGTFSVDTALNLTGYTLSSGLAYGSFVYIRDDGYTTPLRILDEDHFEGARDHPSGIVRLGSTQAEFFPADPYGRRWEGADVRSFFSDVTEQVGYRYVPMPLRVTTLSQTLQAPDEARDYLQGFLTTQILEAGRAHPDRVASARAYAERARSEFVVSMVKRVRRESTFGEGHARGAARTTSDWIVSVA